MFPCTADFDAVVFQALCGRADPSSVHLTVLSFQGEKLSDAHAWDTDEELINSHFLLVTGKLQAWARGLAVRRFICGSSLQVSAWLSHKPQVCVQVHLRSLHTDPSVTKCSVSHYDGFLQVFSWTFRNCNDLIKTEFWLKGNFTFLTELRLMT